MLNRKIDLEVISKTHGQIKYLPKLTWAARINRKTPTQAERLFWEKILCKKQTGYKFVRQKPINRFILDFYCSELNLAIEADGSSHQNKNTYDDDRDAFLRQIGIQTLRFTNEEILKNIIEVKQKIHDYISSPALSREGGRKK